MPTFDRATDTPRNHIRHASNEIGKREEPEQQRKQSESLFHFYSTLGMHPTGTHHPQHDQANRDPVPAESFHAVLLQIVDEPFHGQRREYE